MPQSAPIASETYRALRQPKNNFVRKLSVAVSTFRNFSHF